MTKAHEHFMRQALAMAHQGLDCGKLPIGAVVVLDDKIIAAAHTMEQSEGRLLVHADLLALEAADKIKPFSGKRRDVKLYVTGEPCLMCLGAAMSFWAKSIMDMNVPVMGPSRWRNRGSEGTRIFPTIGCPKLQAVYCDRKALICSRNMSLVMRQARCGDGRRP